MSTFQAKEHLKTSLDNVQKRLVNDLKAIPADKVNTCPGGCARTPLNFVAECAAVNGMIAATLLGQELPQFSTEERDAFLNSFDTADKTLAYFSESIEKLQAAIDTLDENRLGETREFFGAQRTLFGIVDLGCFHMGYHDGQLNYIHMLNGDREMYWGI